MAKKKSLRFKIETVPKEKCVTGTEEWYQRWREGNWDSFERRSAERKRIAAERHPK